MSSDWPQLPCEVLRASVRYSEIKANYKEANMKFLLFVSRGLLISSLALLIGCATLTEDAMTPIAMSFSDGSNGNCDLQNKRGLWQTRIPTTIPIRKSDDSLIYKCDTTDGRKAAGAIPSTMGGKIIASAVFLDFGITDAITDKHRQYPANFVIPIEGIEAIKATMNLLNIPANEAARQLTAVSETAKKECRFIASITKGAGGSGDVSKHTEKAMASALSTAANAGADSYYLVKADTTATGSTVVLEALECRQAT